MQFPLIKILMARAPTLLFVALTLLSTPSSGMEDVRLNALKVAYVYNFTKFIEWQQEPSDNFRICINTDNQALIKEFSKIEKKGPKITILDDYLDNPNQWRDCQVVYLENPRQLPQHTANHFPNTLLVSSVESENVQIYFVLINNKLRFSIGKERAEQSGLSISSKLLRLAHEVY